MRLQEEPTRGADGSHRDAGVARVVGIGSSAGGLEALQVVLRGLVPGKGLAYIVAQHVSPQHRSLMAELLDKETVLPVTVATDGEVISADRIYVTPPNADIGISGTRIQLSSPPPGHGPKPSIDGLFISLAEEWGASAVAVLLSGTGDDGTYGMREVKAAGGLAIAQDPLTAKYDAMPSAAIRAGVTDLILKPAAIGEALAQAVTGLPVVRDDRLGMSFLHQVLEELRRSGAGDFAHYKQGTLLRQIARRMAVLQLSDEADYVTYLAANPAETRLLRQSILVSVTSFRRDPSAWEALAELLQERWGTREPGQQLRIWVPGCATGEEACTVAMLADQILGCPEDLSARLKIFATDLDEVSLDYARRASYPVQAVASLPPAWREKYFMSRGATVEVSGRLRDAIIFARHDIASDPAFVRLDLVSFRNVLIYFDAALQSRVLRGLHYALRPDGVLFLGKSDGLGAMQEWFAPLSSRHRIYERVAGLLQAPDPAERDVPPPPIPLRHHPVRQDHAATVRDGFLRAVAGSAVIVDTNDRVAEILGEVSPFLSLSTGQFDDHIGALLRPDLRVDVRGLMVQVRASGVAAATEVSDGDRRVAIQAVPLVTSAGTHVGLIFRESAVASEQGQDSDVVSGLRSELASTREALQATIEELETSNEELQATNEEMTASAEELQASNEELETINEELQATNEELGSLNQESQVRQQELALANDDLQNIQNALAHAIVIVDRELRITRYSPLAVRVFALVESDVGRMLTHVPATVDTTRLEPVLRQVIASGERAMLELQGDNRSHLAHIVAYTGSDGFIKGAILSITDVSSSAWSARAADEELLLLRAMTEGLDEVVWRRESDGRISFINRAVYDIFGVTPEQAMADPSALDAGLPQRELAEIGSLASPDRPRYLRYRVRVPGGTQQIEVEDVVHTVLEHLDGERTTIGSIRRLLPTPTGVEVPETSAVAALLSMVRDVVLVLDGDATVAMAGQGTAHLLGISWSDLIGRSILTYVHEQDVGSVQRVLSQAAAGHAPPDHVRVRMIPRGGTVRWVEVAVRPLSDGESSRQVMVISDLTEQRETALDMSRRLTFDAGTGLLNRSSFIEALRVELGRQTGHPARTAVLWIDLDGFKEVNDQYGHAAGDAVLRVVADRLQAACRPHDRIGRLGGDEFGVMVAGVESISEIETLASRIVEAVSLPVDLADWSLTVGASVGVALAPQDGQTAEDLLNAADAAMYEAKRAAGNRFQYYRTGLNEQATRRASLRQDLAEAIRNRAFVVVYQPIVDLATGRPWGFEALVRWQRGDTLVAAGEFIATAQETGQIRHIGRQVLEHVFADLPGIIDLVPEAKVCVNMSVPELEDPSTLRTILHDAPAEYLENLAVEITESALLAEDSPAMGAITVLNRRGVAICLDDFGTGFANFVAVERLGPDVIKADRSFVDRAVSGTLRARSLLTAVVALSEAVGSQPLAEGISSSAHLDAAESTGVRLAQGFHIAMPMALADLTGFVRDGH